MTTALPPSAERRTLPRSRILQRGRVCYGAEQAMSFDCTIRNLTATGAMLRSPAQQPIPESFTLLHVAGGIAFDARVTWRRGTEVGVQFQSRQDLKGPVPDEFRAMRRLWAALATT
ncbi:MAG TPA: PilZ domain-containing protein [Phenylobacterium sp.]|nr:PilZ domain-containing protein [Phenylobacterium sp.]